MGDNACEMITCGFAVACRVCFLGTNIGNGVAASCIMHRPLGSIIPVQELGEGTALQLKLLQNFPVRDYEPVYLWEEGTVAERDGIPGGIDSSRVLWAERAQRMASLRMLMRSRNSHHSACNA